MAGKLLNREGGLTLVCSKNYYSALPFFLKIASSCLLVNEKVDKLLLPFTVFKSFHELAVNVD